jgi:hypothetical protein
VKLAGIDYSTRAIDIVFFDPDELAGELPWWNHYDLPAVGNAFERTREVAQVLPARRSVLWEDVYGVAIEEAYGHGGSAAPLVRVQGAILSCLPPELEVRAFSAGYWKTRVGLPGNASKERVREWVMAELATEPAWPQDACDAYCIARALELELEVKA